MNNYEKLQKVCDEIEYVTNFYKTITIEEYQDSDTGYIGHYYSREIEIKKSEIEIIFNSVFLKAITLHIARHKNYVFHEALGFQSNLFSKLHNIDNLVDYIYNIIVIYE